MWTYSCSNKTFHFHNRAELFQSLNVHRHLITPKYEPENLLYVHDGCIKPHTIFFTPEDCFGPNCSIPTDKTVTRQDYAIATKYNCRIVVYSDPRVECNS